MVRIYLILVFLSSGNGCFAWNYYVSSSGVDSNPGTLQAPFQTLVKITSTKLMPGDTVFFKRGDRFNGHLLLEESGKEEQPIVITSYGFGSQPVITGEVGIDDGGDYREPILLSNSSHYVFDGLEINNERKYSRQGVNDKDSYGIYVENSGDQIMRDFTFRNMTFRNIYGLLGGGEVKRFNSIKVAGLRLAVTKDGRDTAERNIQNVLVEDCYFTNIQRLGIHVLGLQPTLDNDVLNKNKNLVFRNNRFYKLGGTCILPIDTYNCLIENNEFLYSGDSSDPRMSGRGSAVWVLRCINTVIQYNRSLHTRGYLDSHGIHIDFENRNTFVQYNYSEDCEGGFVEILAGNYNSIYRYNVSVNDGWRDNPKKKNSNNTIWIARKIEGQDTLYSENSFIYNNTIYLDSTFSTSISINAKNTYIFNNIFYAEKGTIGGKHVRINNYGTDFFMSNNLYWGSVDKRFISQDTAPIQRNPGFSAPGSMSMEGFRLKESRTATIQGASVSIVPPIPGAQEGIFSHVPAYPKVDFFGNGILSDDPPFAGASNGQD